VSNLPNLTLAVLERVFPRSFLALQDSEKSRLAKELAAMGSRDHLEKFPEWLGSRKWSEGRGFLPDLARLELCLRQAGVAGEVPSGGFDRVANAGEPEWYGARFRFDPGFRIVESDWPLEVIFADPDALFERSPGIFLVSRVAGKSLFRSLGTNEHDLLRSLSLGVPLGRVLEKNNGPDLDARTLQRWMESGLLRAIDWASG
jgi:hypothetical protein